MASFAANSTDLLGRSTFFFFGSYRQLNLGCPKRDKHMLGYIWRKNLASIYSVPKKNHWSFSPQSPIDFKLEPEKSRVKSMFLKDILFFDIASVNVDLTLDSCTSSNRHLHCRIQLPSHPQEHWSSKNAIIWGPAEKYSVNLCISVVFQGSLMNLSLGKCCIKLTMQVTSV